MRITILMSCAAAALAVASPFSLALGTPPAQPRPAEKSILIINAAGLDAALLDYLADHAQQKLRVPFRTVTTTVLSTEHLADGAHAASMSKGPMDEIAIVLMKAQAENLHMALDRKLKVACVDVGALKSDDAVVFKQRLARQVMRGAAFLFDLPTAPIPFCVTFRYSTMDELDSMAMELHPPWQAKFADAARERGLVYMDFTAHSEGK